MEQLFTNLGHAVEGAPLLALGASFVWGVLSIILSPCHLASIPLIVGFISKQGQVTARRAFWTSTLFALGILITIAAIGAITAAAGRTIGDVGRCGNYFVALIFFVVGLHLLGVIPMPFSGPGQVGLKRKGYVAAFSLGLVFGIALGPCTFAYMAPMLGVTFKLAATNSIYGASLLLAYGVGHCAVIVAAGTSTEFVQRFLNWNEQSKGVLVVRVICGILVIFGGLWLIYTAPAFSASGRPPNRVGEPAAKTISVTAAEVAETSTVTSIRALSELNTLATEMGAVFCSSRRKTACQPIPL